MIILPVIFRVCENCSLAPRDKQGLKVSESRMLGRISGPNRDEVMGLWRKTA
jgi:hypothetical protein